MRAKPAEFSSASISVSNDCTREVSAAPRSQVFSEPIRRNVGSCESRPASLTSSQPPCGCKRTGGTDLIVEAGCSSRAAGRSSAGR